METGKFEMRFKFICPVCRKVEVDHFLKACFGCWKGLSSVARRELSRRPLSRDWIEAGYRQA